MRFGVIVFPGSNCDDDMVHVLGETLGHPTFKIWHKSTDLNGLTADDCIIVPGGFSFGDYLRSGAIARFSPIMEKVIDFANAGGKVFGICNGFQILCEAGLLAGVLTRNENQKYISKTIPLRVETSDSIITSGLSKGQVLHIPIAHGDGRYQCSEAVYNELKDHDQILFRYCDETGDVNDSSNPNGSIDNIAGICNRNKNVFGMMPHPERAAESVVGNVDGLEILKALASSSLQPA